MQVVKISGHSCVRVSKMAIALSEKGHNVHVMAKRLPYYNDYFSSFTATPHVRSYVEAIKLYEPIVDIWHCHNEPTWFVTAVKEHSSKPVVLDIHDSYSQRMSYEEYVDLMEKGENPVRITTEERNNFQLADALVFPGDLFAKNIIEEFGLKQPYIVLPSYVPMSLYQYKCFEHYGGLVYEGKVNLKSELKKYGSAQMGFKYCDYEELAKQATEMNMDFHIYSARNDNEFKDIYKNIAVTHPPEDFDSLLACLTRHDWGLVGNVFPTREWDVAFPNKLFEYIAACVPVVAINAKECAEFVKEHGIGIEVESLKELGQRWSEHRECRYNLIKKRQDFSMNNHIHKLEKLYQKLCT